MTDQFQFLVLARIIFLSRAQTLTQFTTIVLLEVGFSPLLCGFNETTLKSGLNHQSTYLRD